MGFTTSRSEHSKQLGVFTVVKFPNDLCVSATTGRNGTCYTNSECAAKGGSSSGSCASSFGVCCVFEKTCGGGSVAENCTYFTSSSRTAGASCSLTICKSSSDVCQLRLDFETFTLSNPYTSTAGAGATNTMTTQIGVCTTDFFSVSTPGGKAPPLICGENAGHHIYVPASESCNVLSSYFGTATTSTTSAFTIKITQVKCNAKNAAPDNFLQYFTTDTGTIETFNYQSGAGTHLANQDYCYCIRADRTACTVCYALSTVGGPVFGLGLGRADANWSSFDHIVIPNSQCPVTPTTRTTASPGETVDRYCGIKFNCVTGPVNDGTTTGNIGTICSSSKPFQFCFKSDGQEAYQNDAPLTEVDHNGDAAAPTPHGTRGFQILY